MLYCNIIFVHHILDQVKDNILLNTTEVNNLLILGPLTYNNKGRHTVVGVTSFGAGCGYKQHPGVYSRVTEGLDWIKAELSKSCDDFNYADNEACAWPF